VKIIDEQSQKLVQNNNQAQVMKVNKNSRAKANAGVIIVQKPTIT